MLLDQSHLLNKRALEHILLVKGQHDLPPIAVWDSVRDPYMSQGSHPDIVTRLWKGIGSSLPEDCRCLVYGTPALVHPQSGIILGFCNGTVYCLRLTEASFEQALQAGAKTIQKWFGGRDTDMLRDLGPNWIFGYWSPLEIEWCQLVYEQSSLK